MINILRPFAWLGSTIHFVGAVVERMSQENRPIGLSHLQEFSDDDLLNQLSNPISTSFKFQPSVSQKKPLSNPLITAGADGNIFTQGRSRLQSVAVRKAMMKTAPAFAYTPPVSYQNNPQTFQKPTNTFSGFSL